MKLQGVKRVMGETKVKKVLAEETSKSGKMKTLFEGGYSVKQISQLMNVRYNFVYNVVSNHCMVNGLEVESSKQGPTKKDLIVEQWKQGSTLKEIAINLKTNYNYVFNVVKKHKEKEAQG